MTFGFKTNHLFIRFSMLLIYYKYKTQVFFLRFMEKQLTSWSPSSRKAMNSWASCCANPVNWLAFIDIRYCKRFNKLQSSLYIRGTNKNLEMCPLYTGSNNTHYSINDKNETALYRQWFVIQVSFKTALTVLPNPTILIGWEYSMNLGNMCTKGSRKFLL